MKKQETAGGNLLKDGGIVNFTGRDYQFNFICIPGFTNITLEEGPGDNNYYIWLIHINDE